MAATIDCIITYNELLHQSACNMIGYWHDTVVCLSDGVLLSVCSAVHCGTQSRYMYKGLKVIPLYVFLVGHFLFTSSETFAVGCAVQPPTIYSENRTAEISTWLFQTRHFRRFGSAGTQYEQTILFVTDSIIHDLGNPHLNLYRRHYFMYV